MCIRDRLYDVFQEEWQKYQPKPIKIKLPDGTFVVGEPEVDYKSKYRPCLLYTSSLVLFLRVITLFILILIISRVIEFSVNTYNVSYTHLDVYKRQQ